MHRYLLIFTLTLTAGSALALGPLKDVAVVRDGIIDVGMAYEIGDKCGSIEARYLRGLSFLNELKAQAASLGYTEAEIDAYIDDDAEKEALEAAARQQLADLGAVVGDEASFCAVGVAQIAAGTQVGQLLR
jgi:Family of unknown function (DUF5333)